MQILVWVADLWNTDDVGLDACHGLFVITDQIFGGYVETKDGAGQYVSMTRSAPVPVSTLLPPNTTAEHVSVDGVLTQVEEEFCLCKGTMVSM